MKPFNDRELRTAIEVALKKHELESHLAERERWFATTLRSIGDAVIAADANETVTFLNPVAEKLTGWKHHEAVGRKLAEVFCVVDPAGRPIEQPLRLALRDMFAVQLPTETGLVPRDGRSISIDDNATPIIDEHGKVLGGVVVFRDITERKKLEARLAQSERVASLGTMAAGMAHEINNPLAYVITNVALVTEGLEGIVGRCASPSDLTDQASEVLSMLREFQESLRDANEGAERVRRIVHDIKKFVRAEDVTRASLDLPHVLDSAAKLTAHAVRHHARLVKDYGTTPYIEANEGQLTQVFTNLLINAAQAIGDGATDHHAIRITTRTDAGGRAVVEIRDTGCGIARELLPRIFEPFYTTKSVGAGMGLGLSIVHSTVTAIGGEVTVDSQLGKGTVFRLAFPPAASVMPEAERSHDIAVAHRRGKVLVVDDEPAVARSIERVLRSQHDVVVAAEGRDALARIARGERFDVIFCDMMMPNMSGIDVHQALATAEPDQAKRLIFMTGGAFTPATQLFLDTVANVTITKPFAAAAIRKLVADYVSEG